MWKVFGGQFTTGNLCKNVNRFNAWSIPTVFVMQGDVGVMQDVYRL